MRLSESASNCVWYQDAYVYFIFSVSGLAGKNSMWFMRAVEKCLCTLRPRQLVLMALCVVWEARLRRTAVLRVGVALVESAVLVAFIV